VRAWLVERHGEPREALRRAAERPPPEPGPGTLRLAVAAAGIGLPDLYLCRGSYALTPALPFTPGQEAVGTVEAVGPGVRARVGERVMAVSAFFLGHGSFAGQCLALDDFALPVPDAMGDAEAAGFAIAFHTAWVGLVRRAGLRAGETLLVLGAAGGSGSAALQLGAALGARVLATAGGPAKTAFCRELGAERAIDYRSEDVAEAVRDATGGRGADVVYDTAGGEAFAAATRCIAHEGRLLLVGFGSGSWGRPDPAHLVTHNYSVLGVMPGGYDRAFREQAHSALLGHWRAGRLRVALCDVAPFDALPTALERLAAGGVSGKLVLQVADGRS
jgi:NADPH2:quinone reductase